MAATPVISNRLPPVLVCYYAQGATFSETATYLENGLPVDFDGYTGTAQVFAIPSAQVIAEFAVTFPPTTGEITVDGTAAQMATLKGNYICRVFGDLAGVVTALLDIQLTVTAPKA